MTVAGVRARVAAALEAVTWPAGTVVRGYPAVLESVEAPTVVLGITQVDPPTVACPGAVVTVDVVIVAHLREPGPADDLLDELLDTAASALDADPTFTRSTTERVSYLDTWPAYRLTLEVGT